MATFFSTTTEFDNELIAIENHILKVCKENNESEATFHSRINALDQAIEALTSSLEQTHTTYQASDKGEHSKPIHDGRFRIYYVIQERSNHDLDITYSHIESNRGANIHRYPAHKIRTFGNTED